MDRKIFAKSFAGASELFPVNECSEPLSENEQLNYLMSQAGVTREQSCQIMNAFYDIVQFNLLAGGSFKLNGILVLRVDHTPATNAKHLLTNSGTKRTYAAKPAKTRVAVEVNAAFMKSIKKQTESLRKRATDKLGQKVSSKNEDLDGVRA